MPTALLTALDAFLVALAGGLVSAAIAKVAERFPWVELLLGANRKPIYLKVEKR